VGYLRAFFFKPKTGITKWNQLGEVYELPFMLTSVISMNTTFVNPFSTNYTSLKKTFHPYFAILFCQEHDIFSNTVGLKSENKRRPFKIFHHSMLFCKIGVTYISFCFQSKTDNFLVPEKLEKYEEFKRLWALLVGISYFEVKI